VDLNALTLGPQILLQASGETTDFAARLETEDGSGYTVAGDMLGGLRIKPTP
jgi:hypothetical protein